MTTKSKNIINKESENSGINNLLSYLHDTHSSFAVDAKDSQILLQLGVKTETTQFWENFIENPLNPLLDFGNKVDQSFFSIANDIVKGFLIKNKKIVSKAFASNVPLHYCIILKNDTSANRILINKFFSSYNELKFSQKYPVHFQFVPEEFSKNLIYSQQVL